MSRGRAPAIALTVLLAWLAAAAAQTITPKTEDLDVFSFGVWPDHDVPQWTNGVGEQTILKVEVRNNGTAPASYELVYEWIGPAGRTPLNGAQEESFDLQSDPVAPGGGTAVHDFPWRLQPGQEGPGRVEVTVRLAMTLNGQGDQVAERRYDNNVRHIDVFVKTRAVSLAIDAAPVDVEADGAGFVRLAVANGGNAEIDLPLRITQAPTDVRLHAQIHPAVLTVPAQATRTATLVVRFDPAGDFTPFSVRYGVEADPGFGAPRAGLTPTIGMAEPGSLDRYRFAFGGDHGSPVLAPTTGTTAVAVWLANLGVRPDVYDLAATAPEGWTASVDPPLLALKPGENVSAVLNLRPPVDAVAGTPGLVSLQARSSLLAEPAVHDVAVRVAGPAPTLTHVGFDKTPYMGQPAAVVVKATNAGDRPLAAGSLVRLTVQSPGSPTVVLTEALDALVPGAQAAIRFDLPPPVAGGPLRVEARWLQTGSATDPVATEALVHALHLHLGAPPPLTGMPGETLAYRNGTAAFALVNLGNTAETIALEASSTVGDAWIEGPTVVTVAPGQWWTVPVGQRLPSQAGLGSLANLTVTARVAHAAVSNTTATTIADTEAPRLHPGALPARWNAGGQPLPLELRVEDNGLVAHANATVVAPNGTRVALPMAAGPDGLFRAGATLAEAGNHTVVFAAVDRAGNRAAAGPFTVEATALPPPAIRIEGVADGNVTATLTVVVDSELAVASVRAELRQGDLQVTSDLPLDEGRATFILTGFQPGPLQVTLTAQDASGALGTLQMDLTLLPSASDDEPLGELHEAPAPAAGLLAAVALALAACRRRPRCLGADVP